MVEHRDTSNPERGGEPLDILASLPSKNISDGDKYFMEQRGILLQDILDTMGSVLNGLNELNISVENAIAVGKEFETVTELWRGFYSDTEPSTLEDSGVNNSVSEFEGPAGSSG